MQHFSYSPYAMFQSFWQHRSLIKALIQREVVGRYRGSVMGLLWSFLHPLLMLVVYTFVFSVVFKARWLGGSNSKTEFALVLFAGFMMFNLFAECLNRAPTLILANVNYVKKVIFPLEILPLVVLGAGLFHFLISLGVWLGFYLVFFGVPQASILQFPLVLLPLCFLILGLSWVLTSLGVYLRDINQIVGVLVTVIMFLSPVFYPISALPEIYRPYMQLSPITFVVEQARNVLIWGKPLDWQGWLVAVIVSGLIAWLGFAWFQKTRKGFADVL